MEEKKKTKQKPITVKVSKPTTTKKSASKPKTEPIKSTQTKSRPQSFVQNILIIIAAIIVAICLVIDVWFIYIKLLGPQKIISTTYIVGMQEAENETSEPFIEIKYHSNENNNGYECLDIKYNFLLDEEKSSLYSQGIQYVANSQKQSKNFNFEFYADPSSKQSSPYKKLFGLPIRKFYYAFGTFDSTNNYTKREYQSIDNYETTTLSTNPISTNSSFKLEIDNDIYMVKFRGNKDLTSTDVSDEKKQDYLNKTYITQESFDVLSNIFTLDFADYHYLYDVNFLNKSLFESLESVKSGTTQTIVYDFPDIFDYYKYNKETQQYSEEREKDTSKLQTEIRNFYQIKVTVSKDGIQKSSESLFNSVNGNSTFNLTGDYSKNQFFVGRSIIYATLNDFKLVDNQDKTYSIKLNENFINKYEKNKDNIYLSLYLDYKEFYENKDLVVDHPTIDSMCGFKVYKLEINKSYYYGG